MRPTRRSSQGVKIVGAFPANSHPAIVYPVAATVTAKPEAAAYLNFLRGGIAKAVFEQYSFTFLVRADIVKSCHPFPFVILRCPPKAGLEGWRLTPRPFEARCARTSG